MKNGAGGLNVQNDNRCVVGNLNDHFSEGIRVLLDEDAIDLQVFEESPSQKPRHARSNKAANQAVISHAAMSLSLIIYGTMETFEAVRDFFS